MIKVGKGSKSINKADFPFFGFKNLIPRETAEKEKALKIKRGSVSFELKIVVNA